MPAPAVWAIASIGLVREVFGRGTFTLGKTLTFIPKFTLPILGGYEGSSLNFTFPILTTNAGGFLVLGVALAIIAAIENHKKSVAAAKAKAEKEAAALAKGAN